MKLFTFVMITASFFSINTLAQTTGNASEFTSAQCSENETPVTLTLKESFRLYPERRNGFHQFFILVGCSSATDNQFTDRVNGQVYVGKESDEDYRSALPVAISGSVNAMPFDGHYSDLKLLAHGSSTELNSDDGEILVSGNFYSNRDITYSISGVKVPAALVQ